jgi:hypothetical protein
MYRTSRYQRGLMSNNAGIMLDIFEYKDTRSARVCADS